MGAGLGVYHSPERPHMTTDPTESGFTPAQLAAIRGQQTTAPAWLNPTHLPPAELVAKIDGAIEALEELGRHAYDTILDAVRPVMAEYRSFQRDHPIPADADEVVDEVSRYSRLDTLMYSIGQFVTYMNERLDDVPVLEAYGRVLQGDDRTVYQQVGDPWRKRS